MKNTPLYKKYENKKPIAVYTMSNFGGIAILDIIYDIDDMVIACFDFGTGYQKIRHYKIREQKNGRPYIRKNGIYCYLDECIRVEN